VANRSGAVVKRAHLLREQGVGSSNLPAPTNLFSYLENLLEHRVAVSVAFSLAQPCCNVEMQSLRTSALAASSTIIAR
jgi:hypothetical protein